MLGSPDDPESEGEKEHSEHCRKGNALRLADALAEGEEGIDWRGHCKEREGVFLETAKLHV